MQNLNLIENQNNRHDVVEGEPKDSLMSKLDLEKVTMEDLLLSYDDKKAFVLFEPKKGCGVKITWKEAKELAEMGKYVLLSNACLPNSQSETRRSRIPTFSIEGDYIKEFKLWTGMKHNQVFKCCHVLQLTRFTNCTRKFEDTREFNMAIVERNTVVKYPTSQIIRESPIEKAERKIAHWSKRLENLKKRKRETDSDESTEEENLTGDGFRKGKVKNI